MIAMTGHDKGCGPDLPPINELVEFLRRAPSVLDNLGTRFPELQEGGYLVGEGLQLGNEEATDSTEPLRSAEPTPGHADSALLLRQLAEVALSSLDLQIKEVNNAIPRAQSRLVRLRHFRLGAEIATIVGSGSALGAILGTDGVAPTVFAALTLLAATLTILAGHLEQREAHGSSLVERVLTIRDLLFEASQRRDLLRVRLDRYDESGTEWNTAIIDSLVRDANDLAGRINVSLSSLLV